jgi:hypothetical protein
MIETVKQKEHTKDLSANLEPRHYFTASIICGYHLPLSIETTSGSEVERDGMKRDKPDSQEPAGGYVISGTVDKWRYGGGSIWPEAPHIAFANLLVERPEAAEKFIKRYGVLQEGFLRKDPKQEEAKAYLRQHGLTPFESPPPKTFSIDSVLLAALQDELRGAWDNDWELHKPYVSLLQEQIEEGTRVVVSSGEVVLRTVDPWTFICFLFLRDFTAGKLGFCGNPDCPAPYFRKKRKTQKYCEEGACVQYAQRQYSLDWWNRVGKKRREKKVSKNQGKGKKP